MGNAYPACFSQGIEAVRRAAARVAADAALAAKAAGKKDGDVAAPAPAKAAAVEAPLPTVSPLVTALLATPCTPEALTARARLLLRLLPAVTLASHSPAPTAPVVSSLHPSASASPGGPPHRPRLQSLPEESDSTTSQGSSLSGTSLGSVGAPPLPPHSVGLVRSKTSVLGGMQLSRPSSDDGTADVGKPTCTSPACVSPPAVGTGAVQCFPVSCAACLVFVPCPQLLVQLRLHLLRHWHSLPRGRRSRRQSKTTVLRPPLISFPSRHSTIFPVSHAPLP